MLQMRIKDIRMGKIRYKWEIRCMDYLSSVRPKGERKAVMAESRNPKRRTGKRSPTTASQKRRTRRPLGLGEMSQKQFPFIAIVNGETMIVDRVGDRITFVPFI